MPARGRRAATGARGDGRARREAAAWYGADAGMDQNRKGWRDMAMNDTPERAASSGRARWLQVGLVAATAAAPLIARWRSLRETDRAQALRERADALREQASERLTDATEAAQALQQALQRALRQTPAQTPETAPADVAATLAAIIPAPDADSDARLRRLRATLWLAGAGVGLVAAGVVTYIIIHNRALARAEDDALVELSLDHLDQGPHMGPSPDEQPVTEALKTEEPGFAQPPVLSDDDANGALWVGDVTTRAYMPLDTRRGAPMPEPDRRIYFATESHAIAAGYHRAGVAPSERE